MSFRFIKKSTSTVLLLFCLTSIVWAPLVSAAVLKDSIEKNTATLEKTATGNEELAKKTPIDIITNIIKIALGFLGIIFVIFIIISGFQWMTAGGNSDIINKAKQRMINAVIGLVIVLGVFVITDFILHSAIDAIK